MTLCFCASAVCRRIFFLCRSPTRRSLSGRFDSPRPLSGSRPRPPSKSPLPGPSAFKSPLIARAPHGLSPMAPSSAHAFNSPYPATATPVQSPFLHADCSFQQTTPPNPRQTHSPFANQSVAPPFPYDMHTPQSALVPFRFDTGDDVTRGQSGTPQIALAPHPAPAPLHTGGPLKELHDMYGGVKRPSLREAFGEASGSDCDVSHLSFLPLFAGTRQYGRSSHCCSSSHEP